MVNRSEQMFIVGENKIASQQQDKGTLTGAGGLGGDMGASAAHLGWGNATLRVSPGKLGESS